LISLIIFEVHGEEFDYNWEERWVRDEGYLKIVPKAIKDLFKKADISGSDIDHFILA